MKNRIFLLAGFLSFALLSCEKEKIKDDDKTEKSPYISRIYDFKQAPGQFTNDLIGTSILIGSAGNGMVSLGGYGGYIVFGFDHSIENIQGPDLGIFGNPLINAGGGYSEPGIVLVMRDDNKNGLPDDTWYELAGSEYNHPETIKNYTITYHRPASLKDDIKWTDNQGKEGFILKNKFHSQDYYPAWATTNTISFTGTLLRNTLEVADIIHNLPFEFGYSDSGSKEYIALQEKFGRGYNTFDIDWAVDATGKKVVLTSIDFVKVYTGQNSNGNPFHPDTDNERSRLIGEVSTEFAGAVDLKIYKNK